jgi:LacI family transcriptional regulator
LTKVIFFSILFAKRLRKRLRKRFARRLPISTIRDVAEQASVSITTVSHVINGTRKVSSELQDRVLQAMADLDYRPNRVARSLRKNESLTIGIVVPDSTNPFFAEVARSAEVAAFEQGYSVILCNSDGDPNKEDRYIQVLMEKRVDGIIFVSVGGDSERLRRIQDQQIPLIVVDREVPGVEVDLVLADNAHGGWLATNHLIQRGHQRIGCIAGPSEVTPSAERLVGFRRAMSESGLTVDESLVEKGDFQFESGYAIASKWLAHPNPPTALFCCNDLMAVGAIHAASELGLSVPAQVAVVGFDNVLLASYFQPGLTTVAQSCDIMGERAAELLIARIQDPDRLPDRHLLDVELVIRQST